MLLHALAVYNAGCGSCIECLADITQWQQAAMQWSQKLESNQRRNSPHSIAPCGTTPKVLKIGYRKAPLLIAWFRINDQAAKITPKA
jgi:hypothetical protein